MLENALDYGIKEWDFWEMTLAELDRVVESRRRVEKKEAQDRAAFDYIHAALVGRAFACSMDAKTNFPEIYEAYPNLFDTKAKEEERRVVIEELSALRFKQFAQSYNKKYKEVASDK